MTTRNIYSCIIFNYGIINFSIIVHRNNCKPTFAPLCITAEEDEISFFIKKGPSLFKLDKIHWSKLHPGAPTDRRVAF